MHPICGATAACLGLKWWSWGQPYYETYLDRRYIVFFSSCLPTRRSISCWDARDLSPKESRYHLHLDNQGCWSGLWEIRSAKTSVKEKLSGRSMAE